MPADVEEAARQHVCPQCGRGRRAECITAGGARAERPHARRLALVGWKSERLAPA